MEFLDAALRYAARGWPVFPVSWPVRSPQGWRCACYLGEACVSPAKHPARLVRHGLSEATCDERTVVRWWRACPRANIAIVLGERAGVWVLDVDARSGGLGTLADLQRVHGALPRTLRAETGGGGLHLVFLWPGRRVPPRSHVLGPGVDVRGDSSYIVAPPSLHASGARYAWTDEHAAIVHAPAWLAERVMVAPQLARSPPAPAASSTRASGAVVDRARAYLRTLPPAISGQGGHGATFRAALALVRGFELPPAVALDLLLDEYNPRCDPPWSRRELEHKVESASRSRLASGYLLRAPRR